jgi:hypothetical protein
MLKQGDILRTSVGFVIILANDSCIYLNKLYNFSYSTYMLRDYDKEGLIAINLLGPFGYLIICKMMCS